ncbi:MAG TPA: ribosome small subunit-dependent GTPase A, partial [Candidatus Limnocylindria bacterium]|nr:ribosome small subunit-dependent GTPase A [Candidatus Limnocylindria bacterium]
MTPATVNGTILRAQSGFYAVLADDGSIVTAQLRGLLKKERQATDLAVIGDRVRVALQPDGNGAIEHVEERTSKFSRRQPGPRGVWKEDLLVANVDRVLVVFACADPMPHVRMLDRFLVVAEHNEVPATIVANKVDLVGLEAARAVFDAYERIGYPVHYVSAREGIGVEELADDLAGRVSVVTGPSGVGKSTLLNAIQPGLRIETG